MKTHDDTSLHQPTEDARRASEARFRALAAASGAVLYQLSADWMLLQPLDGKGLVPSNDAPVRGWFERNVAAVDQQIVWEEITRCIAAKTPFDMEHRTNRPNGSIGWTRSRAVPVLDERGEIVEWAGTAENISDRKAAEEQLRRSHDTFYHLIQNNPFGVYLVDADFRLRQVSLGAQKVFAQVPRPLLGRDFAEVLRSVWADPFASEAIARFRHTLDTGEAYVAVRTVERRQDVEAVEAYDWRIERVALPDGRFGVVCYFYDLSERQRWEAALRESEERFRMMADAVPQIVWITDASGRVEFFNQQWSKYTGIDHSLANADEVAAKALHPDDGPTTQAAFHEAMRTGSTFLVEHRIRSATGDYRWFLVRGEPYRDPQTGEVVRWFGASVDIHDRRVAEEATRASEDRYRRLVETAHEGVWTIDATGRTTYVNGRMADLLGYSPDEMIGRLHTDFMWEHDRPKGDADMELRRQGAARVWDQRYRRKDGSELWTVASCAALHDASGEFVGALGMFTDITDRKRAEAERQALLEAERAARAEAERAGRMKDEFLATLSHELRTPLSAILGWSQILRRVTHKPESLAEGLEAIERNARAQTRIIEDLLDMSRIISGKVVLNVQPIDLSAVIRAAVETVRPTAIATGVTLIIEPDMPPTCRVIGDPNRLQQVFWNLLSNALKFTPRGGSVTVFAGPRGPFCEVTIADSGEGISREFLPHVFERFRQADASTTRRHGGLGLGLAIVKQLAELHGGSVAVRSDGVGQGATFTVSLPMSTSAVPSTTAANSNGTTAVPLETIEPFTPPHLPPSVMFDAAFKDDLQRMKVLVVDDEPDARALLHRLLGECNAEVLLASSADEAIAILASERPDVLVSDIGMPGEDGYGLLRRVRLLGSERGGAVPAIALTAFARAEDRLRALRAGFQMHVPKPVEPAELLAAVAAVAGRQVR